MSTTTTTTAAEILHHTTAFISETLSQPDHRCHVSTTLLQKVPPTLLNPLTLAAQTIETAISATTPAARSSSLRLAENLLITSNPNNNNPFSSFLLSLLHHLQHRPIDASLSLLDVFYFDPSLTRLEIAPFLFQELFLVRFSPLIEWYNEQRSIALLSLSDYNNSSYNNNDDGDEVSIGLNTATFLSRMSGEQAVALRGLERDYSVLLEENCRVFVEYFKEVLLVRNELGDDGDEMGMDIVVPPTIILKRNAISGDDDTCEEDEIAGQGFESTNRRYNPMWDEADDNSSVELNSSNSNRTKTLSKFPSFFPQRVSPQVLQNHTSPQMENNTHKQKQPLPPCSADLFMEEEEESAEKGKPSHTPPPKDFVCPITTHIFDDPVTLETGQTYERKAIQEWLERGNSTCPITRQKLNTTHLPKTNYVLKRLIATWLEKHPDSSSPPSPSMQVANKAKPFIRSVSPNSVISQSVIEGSMAELRLAITELCTSEILREAEVAVLKIERFWKDLSMEVENMQSLLTKPPVINGFVEVLFNSVDKQVLKSSVLLLIELGSRDDSVIQTLTRVDSDVECIVELFKKGLSEAVVLVYMLNPSARSLVEMDLVDHLLDMVSNNVEDDHDDDSQIVLCVKPRTASVILLGRIFRGLNEALLVDIVKRFVSTKVIENIVFSLEAEAVEERTAAVSILLRCILEYGKCRNIIAERAELGPLLEIFVGVNDGERLEIVRFLSELVKLNRRSLNDQILHFLKEEGKFSTMHTLLIYQQNALLEQSPVVAGLLLQLDLLNEPRKMSIYREEAIDTLISCLRNSESPDAQIAAAETILSLQGRFSYSGKSLSRAILLKRAGLDRSYKSFMQKDQRRHNISTESKDNMEEERAAEEWERRVAFVLVSHEFGLIFEALAEGLKSKYEELYSVCFMTATWLVYMLSILPDTGIRGAARVCLLNNFVTIFKSEKEVEDRALAMLALNSFISDPEGTQEVGVDMREILKGLRELKKSSALAFQMLKVLSEEHDYSADMWHHNELSQEDCSLNGEVLSITCFKGKIFSGHSDGTIKVWISRNSELQLIQEIHEHTKSVTSLAVLHSSEKLYSGSLDKTLRVWSVTNEGIYCEHVEEMKDQINELAVANSIACYIPQGTGVKVHSWKNGSSKVLNQQKYTKCLALVQGKLYCGCQDNSIQEIDLATGTLANIQSGSKKLLGKVNPIYALQVNDGLIYAAGPSFDGANVKIWSTSNYSTVGSLASTLDVRSMIVSSELVYLGCKSGIVEVWCKKKHTRVETLKINPSSRILCMALDSNEDLLIIGTSDGRIQMWGLS